jgi:hypothetical protein
MQYYHLHKPSSDSEQSEQYYHLHKPSSDSEQSEQYYHLHKPSSDSEQCSIIIYTNHLVIQNNQRKTVLKCIQTRM